VTQEAVLKLAKGLGGFALSGLAVRHRLRVLAYHGLWITPGFQFGDRLFMEPQQFEQRMTWLKKSRYKVIPLEEAVDALLAGSLPPDCVVITIDDGWKSTYTHMLPILEALELPATVYVTTWYVENQAPTVNVALRYVLQRTTVNEFAWPQSGGPARSIRLGDSQSRDQLTGELSSELQSYPSLDQRLQALREICELLDVPTEPWWSNGQFHLMQEREIKDAVERGLDIQLHTHRHSSVSGGLAKEIEDNRDALARACGIMNSEHFCYPSGNYDDAAIGILAGAGIRSATTCEEGLASATTDPYRIPRFLDGRSITQTKFEAYLSGALELYTMFKSLRVS